MKHGVCRAFWLVLCLLDCARSTLAHEYWIEPSTFVSPAATEIALSLKVGDGAEIEEKTFDPSHAREFTAIGGAERVEIASESGKLPAAKLRLPTAGTWEVIYRSNNKFIELEPAKFEAYLREDGLESILEARKKYGESERPARESYARCAKAMIRATSESTEKPREFEPKWLGMTLELVVQRDPYSTRAGEHFAIQLLYLGEPLSNALVKIVRLDDPTKERAVRSDSEGKVEFENAPGAWRLSAVHMIRAEDNPGAEWQSYWASLTFRIPEDSTSKAEPAKSNRSGE